MKSLKFLLLCTMVGIITACSTEASFKVNQQLTSPYVTDAENQRNDDAALEKRLSGIISDQLPQSKIKVVVTNFDVLLIGEVVSNSDKVQAETICKRWPGTKQVFNYLEVSDMPQINVSSSLADSVKDRISSQYDINITNIKVTAVDGVVYIMGTNIGNLTALQEAIKGVYTMPEVHKVVNLEQRGNLDYTID